MTRFIPDFGFSQTVTEHEVPGPYMVLALDGGEVQYPNGWDQPYTTVSKPDVKLVLKVERSIDFSTSTETYNVTLSPSDNKQDMIRKAIKEAFVLMPSETDRGVFIVEKSKWPQWLANMVKEEAIMNGFKEL